MLPLQSFSHGVLAEIIRRQPPSAGRTRLAWQMAVGPALARVTTVELVDGDLRVRCADARWRIELARARPLVLERLQRIFGPDAVARLVVEEPPAVTR